MIEVQNLSKQYGGKKALDNISFSVGEREIVGFLGPNGAGKSTTMNILTGYLAPSSGTVRVGGFDIYESPLECKRRIGYLPERAPLYPDMTVREYLSFMYDLKKIEYDRKKVELNKNTHIAELYELVHIGDVAGRLLKNLSKGYQQRVGLAQALLGKPPVLILDEPTVGLDPQQILDVRNLIAELGKTCAVILSSHILQEIQAVCERIIIITNGTVVADDATSSLAAGEGRLRLRVTADDGVRCDEDAVENALATAAGVRDIKRGGEKERGVFEFSVEAESGVDARRSVSRAITGGGWLLLELAREGQSLEDIFLHLVAGSASLEKGAA
ncbi:MAG: ATP-binding cassette domain-containing protein [Treponemataceae bacterium]|nr:MAG: ATP-binding cassette domain-containing protein [Treponemataceae bacterium]